MQPLEGVRLGGVGDGPRTAEQDELFQARRPENEVTRMSQAQARKPSLTHCSASAVVSTRSRGSQRGRGVCS